MRRLATAAFPLALLVALVVAFAFVVGDSRAELENQVFTSRSDRLRMVVPRGWRATDQPSYPGLVLWMMRTQPRGQIVLTSESFTRELYCSWPPACRATPDTPTAQYACALRTRLQLQRMRVGPTQAGPKENEASGLPSVWFEYDDGKRYLRQAVAVSGDRAVSLVLSAPNVDARSSHGRAFDQTLRTLRLLTAAETAPAGPPDAGIVVGDPDAGVLDASTLPADAVAPDAGAMFESAPAPKIEAVGPCPK